MTLANLMIGLKLGQSNRTALAVASALAERFDSSVTGVAACLPIEAVCFDSSIPSRLFEEDRRLAARDLQAAEAEFRTAFHNRTNRLGWRACTTMEPLARHLAREARDSDLVIVESDRGSIQLDKTRHIDVCDLVMQVGRPVLVVPETQSSDRLDRVVVAWKDTRESRRALLDALPLLGRAREITVAGIAARAELCDIRAQLDALNEERAALGYDSERHNAARKSLQTYSEFETQYRELDKALEALPDVRARLDDAEQRQQQLFEMKIEEQANLVKVGDDIVQLEALVKEQRAREHEVNLQRAAERQAYQKLVNAQQDLNALKAQRARKAELEERLAARREDRAPGCFGCSPPRCPSRRPNRRP